MTLRDPFDQARGSFAAIRVLAISILENSCAFRDWLTQHPEADEVQVGHLDETDQSWKRYFGDSFESRQRSYFVS